MIVKPGNSNSVSVKMWRTVLYEALLNKSILEKILPNYCISKDAIIHIFKRENCLVNNHTENFDILIKFSNKIFSKFLYVMITDREVNQSNTTCVSVYRSKLRFSIEGLIYSSTSKRLKILFSMLKKADKRRIADRIISEKDLSTKPLYIIANAINVTPIEFMTVLNDRLSDKRNKFVKTLIKRLIENKCIDKNKLGTKINVSNWYIDIVFNRLLKRFPNLKPYIYIDKNIIKFM